MFAVEGDVFVDLVGVDADVRPGALARTSEATSARRLGGSTPPVGFEGEQSIKTLVRSVSSRSRSSAVKENPRSSRRTSGFGTPPR